MVIVRTLLILTALYAIFLATNTWNQPVVLIPPSLLIAFSIVLLAGAVYTLRIK
jgi:hypothetical protein